MLKVFVIMIVFPCFHWLIKDMSTNFIIMRTGYFHFLFIVCLLDIYYKEFLTDDLTMPIGKQQLII